MPLRTDIKKILVIGSGPIVIGQAAEFDYAGTQACLALKEEGIEVILINNNPATIMTDEKIADKIYIEPLTIEAIEAIIKKERPDGVIGTLGGQTGLNLAVELYQHHILEKYQVELLGTSVDSIQHGEDRELFRQLMIDIHEPIPDSKIIHTFEEGYEFVQEIGYPVIIRPAYTLGGSGGGFANNDKELELVLKRGLKLSPIHQVLIEKSIKGWKEIEYEVMRDANDTCIIVCNMENLDPVGVHTGDSIVVAPSQTLTDVQYQMLRHASLKIIRSLKIVGGCNIQFALNPDSNDYVIIEVNPRVSRSSALASKATGYPIARIATKCAIGYHLDEIINPITGTTYASFEPAIDYIVVKLPRFPFDKFTEAERSLGTQMKATGEVMAIDRTFQGALNKGLRSLESGIKDLTYSPFEKAPEDELIYHLKEATDLRIFAIAALMKKGYKVEMVHKETQIDFWFLNKIKDMVEFEKTLSNKSIDELTKEHWQIAKQYNVSDATLARIFKVSEMEIRKKRIDLGITPSYKLVDTCAAEFEAQTPYYYSTWLGEDEAEVSQVPKILVVGSGPIRIGQGIEFDYCSVQAALAVKEKGYQAIVMNNNPETVSTDYSIADRLYFEPLALEDILNVVEKEKVEGVLVQFGGQTAINIAKGLEEAGVKILGTSLSGIDQVEDREQFYDLLSSLDIPHIKGDTVHELQGLIPAAKKLGYPVLVRPSYVIGGQSMVIFYNEMELKRYIQENKEGISASSFPLLVDRYEPGLECEVDAISDGQDVIIPGIFEHIERAGVHSGDSIAIFPSMTLTKEQKETLVDYTMRICKKAQINGLINIQFVISGSVVYVLEVNPRASRTVPIMSKVTGIPMVELAVGVQLGETLKGQYNELGLLEPPALYAVKAPVFSFSKLKGVDPVLGPEMKSTGELLGLGKTPNEALNKALLLGKGHPLLDGKSDGKVVIFSINDRDKDECLPYVQLLVNKGFKIASTKGTAKYLEAHGIQVTQIPQDLEELKQSFVQGQIATVCNLPVQGRNLSTFGFKLREMAVRYQVPLYTAIDTLNQILSLTNTNEDISVLSLEEYKKEKMMINHGE
ncbi:carbamoyl-phosphate synthase (glutamine-hydrolyzing) large subunit [Terrilactibacillus sp. BCM23-1]|uniref:Carbamoyl phosphate synthase large chain n=1 Tax=Terrilactibacillus tamarindi TaxID=2599694 RepID=A0A6N8CP48_9BACI|nr:carbamoyl-phosphate synthase (glutamine-hydrolyzing) large subunit [Terrilactibacillus tamarindi]MTT31944.1 carbamoyl-phosphate synthase (glutamine-hydrolyzing) large subunit [Terrilactibacillus tamarindi]